MVVTSTWVNRGLALVTGLPEGLTTRPLTLDDAALVTALVTAEELHEVGESDVTVEDVVSEWQRPSYDVASSTIGVFDGERLVAYADLVHPDFGYTGVLPSERGRGIGTALADWLEALARSRGADLISTQVPAGRAADRLLEARGYRSRWTAWDLELPAGAEIVAQPLPAGHALRDARPDEHVPRLRGRSRTPSASGGPRGSLEDFAALVWDRPGHQPWNLRLCVDPTVRRWAPPTSTCPGTPGTSPGSRYGRTGAGAAWQAPCWRTRSRSPAHHGAARCYLSTDSRTGALGLYEKVGMVVSSTWVNRALDL